MKFHIPTKLYEEPDCVWNHRAELAALGKEQRCPSCARQIEDKDFQNLMHASTLAGMAIAHTGTSLPHGLSYAVTYETGMAHGKSVGHFLAGYLAECKGEFEKLGEDVLSMAGFATLEEYESFYDRICGKEMLPEVLLKRTVSDLLGNREKLKNCPYPVDEEILWRMASR